MNDKFYHFYPLVSIVEILTENANKNKMTKEAI